MSKKTIAEQIAIAGFGIGAIELRPKAPFLWASGTRNPIYNDNRMLLGSYENRMLVTNGFVEILVKNKLEPDFICATSLSGIAPGVSLSQKIKKPLVILQEGELFIVSGFSSDYVSLEDEEDLVVATAPWAITSGVIIANKYKLPFAYLRANRKKHGKEKIIEGIIQKGQKAFVVSLNIEDFRTDINSILSKEEISVEQFGICSLEDMRKPLSSFYSGKSVIVIEDLISTGGSALKEVEACRKLGANVLGVISIFNYELESAKKHFQDASCPLYSILGYKTLLEVSNEEKMFNEEELETLKEWRLDQPNWGDKNGFPKEITEKEKQI